MTTPSSLEHFDFLHLLLMLAHNRKTGVMRVFRDEEQFQCWLEEGQVRRLRFVGPGTDLEGVRALTELLRRPEGRFQFEDGLLHTAPRLDRPLEAVAYEALGDLPDLPHAEVLAQLCDSLGLGPCRTTEEALAAMPGGQRFFSGATWRDGVLAPPG